MSIKKFFSLTSITLTLLCCGQSTISGNNNDLLGGKQLTDTFSGLEINQPQSPVHPGDLFTASDAEKILGEQAHLTDSSSKMKGDTLECKCAYTANSKDQKTGKTGNVYFLFEQYAQALFAQKVYSSIKTANENHEGIKVLHDLGDEAYFHTDGQNFYFILVRKGEKMFRMKVNKITATTSLNEFNLVAKNIAAAL